MKVTIYHSTEGSRTLSAIDFTQAWRDRGWSEQQPEVAAAPELLTVDTPDNQLFDSAQAIQQRVRELDALYKADGFRPIKDIAEALGISKPDGGWDESFQLIAEAEQRRGQ